MVEKKCFTYCGDDRCDCEQAPTFSAPEMSLDTFEHRLKAEVAAFFEMWRANHLSDPANWPLEMPSQADWMDQYLATNSD
jgi:hypothetical protein